MAEIHANIGKVATAPSLKSFQLYNLKVVRELNSVKLSSFLNLYDNILFNRCVFI